MAEYELYCFAQSGNAYRAALMLNLIGADWEPRFVDFFAKGEPRSPEYRANVNEMGEVPVLAHQGKKLSQSGVILNYLAERSGKFRPEGEDERLEALRWIIFDNQKVNGFLGPYRFLRCFAKPPGDPAVLAFLKGRIENNSPSSTSGSRAGRSCSVRDRPSPISRWSLISTIRRRNSASISPPSTRTLRFGSTASKRCRAGSIPTT
jgi:glutathione S-transferase